jgi:hypothetical protein
MPEKRFLSFHIRTSPFLNLRRGGTCKEMIFLQRRSRTRHKKNHFNSSHSIQFQYPTMKFSIALALLAATSTEAFAPSAFGVRSSTLLAARVDTTNLVQEALAASKEFGASSKEARLAWETVEEMDSSDNRYVAMRKRTKK